MSTKEYYTPKVVLAVGAHADDVDITCGGTLARWASEGADVYYLILTDSSCGSDDESISREQLTALREQEQRDAAALLGAKHVFFGHHTDGMLEVTQDVKRDVARIIRTVKPDTVVTMDPTVIYEADFGMINHTDHRAAGMATIDAFYPLARDRLSLPELLRDEGLAPHKTLHLLLTNFSEQNYYVDVSSTFERKIDAIMLHSSQFDNRAQMQDMLGERAAAWGAKVGARYAEGFMRIDSRF
ncbi:PIG-L family deacetylase [Aeromicrobium sp.]|nr:PIG-L family deacetylase [Candidatus Saccharibacteria bacterium]